MQLVGIDRMRGMAAPLDYQGLAYAAQSPGTTLQGLQPVPGSSISIDYTPPPSPAPHLQAGPTDSSPGSYIKTQGLNGTDKELQGTLWNMVLKDSTGVGGAIGIYIADVAKDTASNLSKYSSNDDVYLYTVYYRHPSTAQWVSLCPVDEKTGRASAMAMPLDPSDWTSEESRTKFTFACTATGVGAKCIRNWGYKPWKTVTEKVWNGSGFPDTPVPLKPFYDACLIAARADYCQDGQSYTKDGTLVDLFDTIDGFTSINPTAGMSYAPGSTAPMMHEEYQISAYDLATPATAPQPHYAASSTDADVMSLPPEEKAAVLALRKSGMQSSRYGDLDPGRSCLAAPWIDRCDPKEPYACYRDANMSLTPYGAFLAVNSPRHCDHSDATEGAPLDPLCNECVNRVCRVDPTCCGNPGDTFYPGSLVWGGRCVALRNEVCKSRPQGPAWSAGVAAPKPEERPVRFLRGAIGSFEGIVVEGSNRFAEGWACDPDFPTASVPVQISVGGEMGAGTTLMTAMADAPLRNEWQDTVAAECGGAGRHGFRVQVSGAVGAMVYVYGIDLNTPGAPFSLLRGGKKPLPGATVTAPAAAIWSGWLEPTTTGQYTFSVAKTGNDTFRVWVNGTYAVGNWPDPNPNVPGAFVPEGPPQPTMRLQKGVRYGVRVEYQRSGGTTFALQWQQGSGPVSDIPATELYPMAQGAGNGLRGTYFSGDFGGAQSSVQTWDAVDHTWTSCATAPATCKRAGDLDPRNSFAARFEGQVMPPVSGEYLFTADTDGAATIWVNDKLVTDESRRPPGAGNPDTCGQRDICQPGSAISRTCDQGYFCAAQICLKDPACCAITWDAACLQEVATICHLECRPTAPIGVKLLAGVKYDIKLELKHTGGPTSPGARLKLFWALAGGSRSPIPKERLFGETAAPALRKGLGLNAAYFSNTPWQTEYLDRVDVVKLTASAPSSARATLACGGASGPACAGDVLGGPALVAPATATVAGTSVVFQVAGARAGATVTIAEKVNDTTFTTLDTFTYTPSAVGQNVVRPPITLALGPHRIVASQSLAGTTSGGFPLRTLDFSVVPAPSTAPPPPAVTIPVGGIVATNGKIQLGGKATPGTSVSVTGAGGSRTFTVNANTNAWGTTSNTPYLLPGPGVYTLTISQTVGGQLASTTVKVKYALPPLVVDPVGDPVGISGIGAPLPNSKIVVTDGDGRHFADVTTIDIGTGGVFPPPPAPRKALALDPGRHVLKIFQRIYEPDGVTPNLDGEPVTLTVFVAPALGTLKITTPCNYAKVEAKVAVRGSGVPSRTGLPNGVAVYQATPGGQSKRGQVTVDSTTFDVPVTLVGIGKQDLTVRLVASSLSGAGTTESPDSPPCTVVVTPPAPTITKPLNGINQSSTTLRVEGTGVPGAELGFLADGTTNVTPSPTPIVPPSGNYVINVVLPKGPHRLTATQSARAVKPDNTVVLATSLDSNPRVVSIGDVVPPKFTFANPTDPTKPPKIERTTDNETGLSINFIQASGIVAKDGTTVLPVTCLPAGPSFVFPLGTTNVTCQAADATGNVASTTLTVTVKSSAPPIMSATNLVADATGPEGAAVAYQVSATGFIANCAPPGSTAQVPCSNWQRKSVGLDNPTSLGIDPVNGDLYAVDPSDAYHTSAVRPAGKLLRSTDRGVTWNLRPMPGTQRPPQRVTVVRTPGDSAATLYVPSVEGILKSTNGGDTWTTILPGNDMAAASVDPHDPQHLFAWASPRAGGTLTFFETSDGGTSWRFAGDGLPSVSAPGLDGPHVGGVAFDPLNRGRIYVLVAPYPTPNGAVSDHVYRRVGNAPWVRLALPPVGVVDRGWPRDGVMAVAPKVTPCVQGETCPTFPTVFAGGVQSTDGGETWTPSGFGGAIAILFDEHKDGVIYRNNDVSRDYGRTWSPWPSMPVPSLDAGRIEALFQSPTPPPAGTTAPIYAQYAFISKGVSMTVNEGSTWTNVVAPFSGMPSVRAVAIDPVDPRLAYLVSNDGLYKTEDGGDLWTLKAPGFDRATQIAIDPFNPRTLYVTGNVGPYPSLQLGHMSMDGGDSFTAGLVPGIVGTDPGARNVLFHGPSGAPHSVYRFAQSASLGYALNVAPFTPHFIQVLPDAERTVAVSFERSATEGGTILFSGRDAQVAPTTTVVRVALTGKPAKPVFDNSGGRSHMFVSGDARGAAPSQLYKAAVSDLSFQLHGGGQPGIDFRNLTIDGGSAGQLMYTIGTSGVLWQSQDAGKSWAKDPSAPRFVHRLWVSPVDGALFALVQPFDNDVFEEVGRDVDLAPGEIWKRTLGATPPGARVVEGSLRVTCTGDSGRAVTSGSVFPIGTTHLTCTATDVFGVQAIHTIDIEVRDNGPTLTVPAPIVVDAPAPNTQAPVTFSVSATDVADGVLPVCPGGSPTAPKCFSCATTSGVVVSGAQFPLGLTTVTCTARDSQSPPKVSTASFPVTVRRTGTTVAVPTLNIPANMTVEATAAQGAKANPTVTATKAAGGALTPTCTPIFTSATFFPLGTTTESCSVSDAGFTVTRTFTVTVVDKTAPLLTVPATITVAAQGPWGAAVPYAASATDLVDGAVPPGCVPASGSTFGPGTTTVVCRTNDRAGNVASAQFNIIVQDVSPPILTVPTLVEVEAEDVLGARATYIVSATDVQDGTLPVDCLPPSGSWFPTGDTSVSCQVADSAGNTERATFTVRVLDRMPPDIIVPSTITVEATSLMGAQAPFTVTAFDAVSQGVTPRCTRSNGVNGTTPVAPDATFPLGDTTVTCTAADLALNVASKQFHVVVVDTTPPLIPPPPTKFVDTENGGSAIANFSVTATDLPATIGGPRTSAVVVCTPPSGSRFLFGTTAVTCVARDAAGNEAQQMFNVVVRDRVAPVFSGVPANITAYATTTAGAAVAYTPPTATDAFEGPRPVSCLPASGSTFTLNTTTVTCTSSDSSNNVRTATFTVSVRFDTRQPDGSTFIGGLRVDGSSSYRQNAPVDVKFALTGVSAPITNLVARALIAPVAGGVPGTFIDATPVSGPDNRFIYDGAARTYGFALSTSGLALGTYRVRAELLDGLTREVNFNISSTTITITPGAFPFPDTGVLQQGSTIAHFDVRNIGTVARTLTMTAPPPDFQIVGTNCTSGPPLAAGGSCFVDVRFAPQSPPGQKTGELRLTATGEGSVAAAILSGRALAPASLATNVFPTAFGSVALFSPSPATTDIVITNNGDQAMGPITFSFTNPEFSIASNQCPVPPNLLPGHQTCHAFARFTPTALGDRSATVTISTGNAGSASTLLTGIGIAPLTASPTSLTFAPTKVGLAGQSQVITVRNIGTVASGVLTATASPPAFRVTANACTGTNLASNATCNVTIQWLPVVVGTTNGAFSVTGSPNFSASATLTGTGTP